MATVRGAERNWNAAAAFPPMQRSCRSDYWFNTWWALWIARGTRRRVVILDSTNPGAASIFEPNGTYTSNATVPVAAQALAPRGPRPRPQPAIGLVYSTDHFDALGTDEERAAWLDATASGEFPASPPASPYGAGAPPAQPPASPAPRGAPLASSPAPPAPVPAPPVPTAPGR